MLAATQVARSDPDGYTLLIGGLAPQIIAPAIAASPGFDALRDFAPIAYIGGPPITWVVPPASELRTVDDLVAAAKADKLSGYASSGVGTLGHLVVEYVAQASRPQAHPHPLQHRGLRRHHRRPRADGLVHLGRGAGQVQGGTLRALAVTTETRRPDVPSVPTFKELGYDLVASTWFSLAAPKGTCRRRSCSGSIGRSSASCNLPDIQKRLAQDAFDPKPMTPEQVAAHSWRPKPRAGSRSRKPPA